MKEEEKLIYLNFFKVLSNAYQNLKWSFDIFILGHLQNILMQHEELVVHEELVSAG